MNVFYHHKTFDLSNLIFLIDCILNQYMLMSCMLSRNRDLLQFFKTSVVKLKNPIGSTMVFRFILTATKVFSGSRIMLVKRLIRLPFSFYMEI